MRRSLDDYRNIVGDEVISKIYKSATSLSRKHVVHISSTFQGGGVAEMLNSLIPLLNDVWIDTGWRILHGTPDFFTITKKFHNALQGDKINLSLMKKRLYSECNESFAIFNHLDHDCVIVHDPQPLPLIKFYKKRQPWIWRCHIDVSYPNERIWEYLKTFILRYDVVIFSDEKYKKKDLPIPQRVIRPSIDPLSVKNKEISDETITKYLKKFRVPTDKPIIAQISRFDKWKDAEGVTNVFEHVKEKVDCRLILCGAMATDDPEGQRIYERLIRKANNTSDVKIVIGENQVFVNALQRASSVIIQKSLKEGFALTVTEALWKGKPVVASNVGGLPAQIIDGETGFLVDPYDIEGCAERVITLLKDRRLANDMGQKGKEWVKKNFLITRHLLDYINLLSELVK